MSQEVAPHDSEHPKATGGTADPVVEAGHCLQQTAPKSCCFGYGGNAKAYIVYVHVVGDARMPIRLINQTLL